MNIIEANRLFVPAAIERIDGNRVGESLEIKSENAFLLLVMGGNMVMPEQTTDV